jgi:FkbM family methyltransferase
MRDTLTAELRDLFFSLQEDLKPSVSIEVGAFKAEFSHRMRELYPDVIVWAFEANPYNYAANVEKAVANNIKYLNYAVANQVGTIEFLLQDQLVSGERFIKEMGNNSILQRQDNVTLYDKVKVECVALDHFFIQQEAVQPQDKICMWIDVEGASREVLTASAKLLQQVQTIFIEVEDVPFWQNQWLAGDVDKFLKEKNFVKVARDYEYPLQNNVIYVRSDLTYNKRTEEKIKNWKKQYGNV